MSKDKIFYLHNKAKERMHCFYSVLTAQPLQRPSDIKLYVEVFLMKEFSLKKTQAQQITSMISFGRFVNEDEKLAV